MMPWPKQADIRTFRPWISFMDVLMNAETNSNVVAVSLYTLRRDKTRLV